MTTDELLDQMATVMFWGKSWDARARNCSKFAKGGTAREAMEAALALRDAGEIPKTRRRAVLVEAPPTRVRRSLFDD